jgi:hypothetical protein
MLYLEIKKNERLIKATRFCFFRLVLSYAASTNARNSFADSAGEGAP